MRNAERGRRVREQSHLEDMRAAVRGDRERAAARRETSESMQTAGEIRAVPPTAKREPDPEPEAPPKGFLARVFRR